MKIYGFAQSRFLSFFCSPKSLTKSNIFVLFFYLFLQTLFSLFFLSLFFLCCVGFVGQARPIVEKYFFDEIMGEKNGLDENVWFRLESIFVSFFCDPKSLTKSNIFVFLLLFFCKPFSLILSLFFLSLFFLSLSLLCQFCWPSQTHR